MNSYQQAKQLKRLAQLEAFEATMALPLRVQGATLFALWPQKLPKAVRRIIQPDIRQAWLMAKERDREAFRQAFHCALHHMKRDRELLELMDQENEMDEFETKVLEEYEQEVEGLMGVIAIISTLKSITVSFDDASRTFEYDETGRLQGGKEDERALKVGMGLAMDMGGSVLVRQTLPLKAQVSNDKGQLVWKNQERLFGFECGGGSWGGVSPSELKLAYNKDHQTGKPLPSDPSTSMGDAKTLVKQWQKNRKR